MMATLMDHKCPHHATIYKNAYSFIPKLQEVLTMPVMEDLQSQYLVALLFFFIGYAGKSHMRIDDKYPHSGELSNAFL